MERFGTDHCRYARGFTLVELLLVIAMIVVLVGLLTPSLHNVRQHATVASSQATLGAIETGLATFRADANIGDAYPPSWSDDGTANRIASPFLPATAWIDDTQGLSGAALLVMALAGADSQGTPGFGDPDADGIWSDNTAGGDDDIYGLYSVNTSTPGVRPPFHTRYGPYVDIERIRITRRRAQSSPSTFTLEASRGKTLALPVFLDAFGFPILYWRAEPAGQEAVEDNSTTLIGIYRLDDNQFFTGNTTPIFSGTYDGIDLKGAGTGHKIKQPIPSGGLPSDPDGFTLPDDRDTFAYFIHDPNVSTNLLPKNRESYLLISPGPDALYGTSDDITNFEKNR